MRDVFEAQHGRKHGIRARERSTVSWRTQLKIAVVTALAILTVGCAPDAPETTSGSEAGCPTQFPGGHRVVNEWGEVIVPDGYEAVGGVELWSLVGGEEDPVYVMSGREGGLEEVVAELEESTGEVFVEVCSPRGRAVISTPIETEGGVGSVAVVELGPTQSVLIAATDRQGSGRAVRGGLEAMVAGFSISTN